MVITVVAAAVARPRPGRGDGATPSGPRRRRDGSTARVRTSPKLGRGDPRTRRDVAAAAPRPTRHVCALSSSTARTAPHPGLGRRAAEEQVRLVENAREADEKARDDMTSEDDPSEAVEVHLGAALVFLRGLTALADGYDGCPTVVEGVLRTS